MLSNSVNRTAKLIVNSFCLIGSVVIVSLVVPIWAVCLIAGMMTQSQQQSQDFQEYE